MPLFVCFFFIWSLFSSVYSYKSSHRAVVYSLLRNCFCFYFFYLFVRFFVCQTKLIRYLNAIYRSMVQRAELFLHNIDWNISHGFLLRIWLFVALSSYWRNVYDEYDPAVISCGWPRIASTILSNIWYHMSLYFRLISIQIDTDTLQKSQCCRALNCLVFYSQNWNSFMAFRS